MVAVAALFGQVEDAASWCGCPELVSKLPRGLYHRRLLLLFSLTLVVITFIRCEECRARACRGSHLSIYIYILTLCVFFISSIHRMMTKPINQLSGVITAIHTPFSVHILSRTDDVSTLKLYLI